MSYSRPPSSLGKKEFSEFLLNLANTPHSYELFDTIEEEELARKKSLSAKPSDEKKHFSYFLFGCHGSRTEAQKKVARWMKGFVTTEGYSKDQKKVQAELKIHSPFPTRTLPVDKQTRPSFAIAAGDLIYTDGAKSINDKIFKESFYDIYSLLLIYFL